MRSYIKLGKHMPESKTTYRQHYKAIEFQGGHVPELHVEIPLALKYIFDWFAELSGSRGEGGIPYSDIEAWATLTGRSLLYFEVALIKRMDYIYMEIFNG